MPVKRLIYVCLFIGLSIAGCLQARTRLSLDSLERLLDLPAIGVPIVQYSPETEWVLGGAVQGYFRCKNQSRSSIVQLSGAYTFRHQWYLKTSGTVYFGRRTSWQLSYRLGYRDYPDSWYERGNRYEWKESESYTSQRFNASLQPLYVLPRHWAIGPDINAIWEKTSLWKEQAMMGIGVMAQYDTRDQQFYPSKGLFFSISCSNYEPLNHRYRRVAIIKTDLRNSVPIYKSLLFAWQHISQWAIGKDIPNPMLPTLGGEDMLRGIPQNMYRDNALWALQTELRFPIYRLLRGTVFASIGDVYNLDKWRWAVPKVGYGLGLRLCINRIKVNVRLDVARNNVYKRWDTWESYSVYFTAIEAF